MCRTGASAVEHLLSPALGSSWSKKIYNKKGKSRFDPSPNISCHFFNNYETFINLFLQASVFIRLWKSYTPLLVKEHFYFSLQNLCMSPCGLHITVCCAVKGHGGVVLLLSSLKKKRWTLLFPVCFCGYSWGIFQGNLIYKVKVNSFAVTSSLGCQNTSNISIVSIPMQIICLCWGCGMSLTSENRDVVTADTFLCMGNLLLWSCCSQQIF